MNPQNITEPTPQNTNSVIQDNPDQPVKPEQTKEDLTMQTLIPTKNKFALKSYYFGCIGVLPFIGLPFSVLAVTNYMKAMKLYKENPTPGAKGHAITGLVLAIIELTVFAVFVTIVAVSYFTS